MTESTLLIGLIGLGITLLAGVIALILIAGGARRGVHYVAYVLDERYTKLETELEQAQLKVQRLEERLQAERPEKLMWQVQHATEELEQLREAHSELQRQVGRQKQEWLNRAEKQDQQLRHLEQERQHLMEELERWHDRYAEAQKQVERLTQERSEDQQTVEQLTQLRERFLEELREIGKG
jgi:chromosome segregation ATPase